jgi:type III secretion protein Q
MMRHNVKPIRDHAELVPFPALRTTERPLTLQTVATEQAEALEWFHRRRSPLLTQISGRSVTIKASWLPADVIAIEQSHLVRISVDGREGLLLLSAALTDILLGDIDASLSAATLAPAHTALLLELALQDALGRLETMSGHRIALQSLTRGAALPDAPLAALAIALDVQGFGASTCWLALARDDAIALARLLDTAAGIEKVAVEDLAVPVSVRLASASPTIGELKTLRRGDVMLVDDECGVAMEAVAVIAEHLIAPVDLVAPGIRFSTRPVGGRGSAWEWSMEIPPNGVGLTGRDDAEFDDLPVRVLFEIGRLELSLGELRRLDVGSLLPLARGADNAVDIVTSGRRIGRGALIRIGESVGVRVTRLFDHG